MTWDEVANTLGVDVESLKRFNVKLINIKVLNKGTVLAYPGRALNVSYSEDGLK
jgi:LysM repeat protein